MKGMERNHYIGRTKEDKMTEQQHMVWNKIMSKKALIEYRWWLIFGTIATIIVFSIYANFNIGWREDNWWIYTILIIGAFLGELFTKPINYQFILKAVYFSIFQSFLWLFIWAAYLVASGEMYEPSPLPKILMRDAKRITMNRILR